jgi:CheY-like chemotaxis protein
MFLIDGRSPRNKHLRGHIVKVLIAEDEPLFRTLLLQLLSPEFDLTVTEDGINALARLQKENGPVLAILDWVMPGLTGIEVCRELRAHRQTAPIYVILLTARNSSADIISGLRGRGRLRDQARPSGGTPRSRTTRLPDYRTALRA